MDPQLKRRNGLVTAGVLAVMSATAILPWVYAPLYRRVCGLLGIESSLGQGQGRPADALLKTAREGIGRERADKAKYSLVNFMGVSGQLPIDIRPLKPRAWIQTGSLFEVTYRLTNLTDRPLDFKAMHMLAPEANAGSFQLIKCFCNDHRVIKAHETQDLPLTFRLVKPVPGDAGLTVNYTIFDWPGNGNKKADAKLTRR